MMKKWIAAILVLILCVGMLCGCSEQPASDEEIQENVGFDYDAAFAKYDPYDIVMTVNGDDVTWSEFYYMLYTAVYQLQYYLGDLAWDEECLEGYGVTFEEYAMQLTMDSIKQFHAINKKAADEGLSITESDREKMQATMEAFKLSSCGEDATDEDFRAYLLKTFFLTEEVYGFVNENSVLYEKLFVASVGEKGEKMSDEDIAEFVERAPYVSAKHILIKTIDENGEKLGNEAAAEAKKTAEKLLSQLQTAGSQKARIAKFDELMNEYTEDEGIMLFPDGYTFTTGQMYPVFEEAAFALEEYEISGLVESEAGYHIIMRIPTLRSYPVDFDYESGIYYTVETYAATDIYSRLISGWIEEAEVVWKDEFKDITAEEIFS